jgi:hypothetical protein
MTTSYSILGHSPPWAAQFSPSVIPPEYFIPQVKMGFRLARKRVTRFVDTAMPVDQSNPVIRWRFPNAAASLIDLRTAVVWITMTVNCTGGTACASNLIWNMFERVRLDQANNYIEDRRYFRDWETLQYWLLTFPEQQTTQGSALYGYGNIVSRQNKSGGWTYALPVPFASMCRTVLPFFQNSGQGVVPSGMSDITLQWEIGAPATWIEVTAGATNPVYQIQSMSIEYDEMILEANLASFVSKWFGAAGWKPQIPFRSHWTGVWPLNASTDQDIQIDSKYQSIAAIYAVIRDSSTLSTPTQLNKYETFLGPAATNLISWQWEINGVLWPDKIVTCNNTNNVSSYVHYLIAHNQFHSRRVNEQVTPIDIGAFNNDKFVIVYNGNPHPFNPNLMTPTSTWRANNYVHLRLQFSAAPPAGLQVVYHVIYWKLWNYNSSGSTAMVVEV